MTPLKEAGHWMSLFCRLRDALEWNKRFPVDITEVQPKLIPVKCCTCGKFGSWFYTMDAGHFISKGKGGQSGVRFDERNVHAQCKGCNAFHQGKTLEYRDFMLGKYGQETIDELRRLDKITRRQGPTELMAIAFMYKDMYEKLLKSI